MSEIYFPLPPHPLSHHVFFLVPSPFTHKIFFPFSFSSPPGKILFRRSHVRDVAMKRLRFIDDYCRVKESLLSTSFRSPSGSGECPLQHVKCQKVTAHTVLSHALNMRFQGVLAVKSCESELFWDIWRGCDVLWHLGFAGCEVLGLVGRHWSFATAVFRICFHACHSGRNWATTVSALREKDFKLSKNTATSSHHFIAKVLLQPGHPHPRQTSHPSLIQERLASSCPVLSFIIII